MLLKKIVVAEDDDAIAHLVNMALGDAGYLCLRAHDGEEALRLVRAHDPDLLVLDVMMPRVDGLEVARRLKSDVMWSRTPILMLTALGGVDAQVEGLEAGADAYMAKPFNLREFAARVKALIRASRRERDRSTIRSRRCWRGASTISPPPSTWTSCASTASPTRSASRTPRT